MHIFFLQSGGSVASCLGRLWRLRIGVAFIAMLGAGAVVAQQPAKGRPAAPAAPASSPAPAHRAGLPGGASALAEVHADWTVNCRIDDGVKRCSLAHQQRSNGKVLLTMEVQASADGRTPAALLLPFGLAVTQGVTLTVDDQKASAAQAFSTCLPGGCVVPLSLDQALLRQLGEGGVLKIAATVADQSRPISFTIALDGFAAALARVNALSAD